MYIKSKEKLLSSCYYSNDTGLILANTSLLFFKSINAYIEENIFYLELKRNGFQIAHGIEQNNNINFVAYKSGIYYYIQVTDYLQPKTDLNSN
jgi:predicted membrane-bound dolichyl-phosphate-mannose-protein mannosyltransferase